MAGFNELIRNFDKIRDYMRDFYIYGFKSRTDFKQKSSRTYDNEKRRIESYMGDYMKWEYTKTGKNTFISMDCARLFTNPFYAAWKSKAFTNNDLMLHFYLLDALSKQSPMTIQPLTDLICLTSKYTFEIQTIRNKCNEYVALGILNATKLGKALEYELSRDTLATFLEIAPGLREALQFFQGALPFGEVGSFLMDHQQMENKLFSFQHYYVAHTLEDAVLLELLSAIRQRRHISFVNLNESGTRSATLDGVPLKIFVSTATGRRYLCVYKTRAQRFFNYRLDHIKSVEIGDIYSYFEKYQTALENHADKVWGVGFGGRSRKEIVCMKLYIDEATEGYVLKRLEREGHGGEILHLAENTFLYTKEVFDTNDMSPWIKSFTGRILQLEGTNQTVLGRFYNDIHRMYKMYEVDDESVF